MDTTKTYETIRQDDGFSQYYGSISQADLNSPNHGHSLQFSFPENGWFASDTTKKWFPDVDFKFTAKQFHFHHGHGEKLNYTPDNGSEDTTNGQHHDLEIHIVHSNDDANTTSDFLASVTAILFDVNETMTTPSFADTFFQTLINTTKSQSFDDDFLAYIDFDHRYVYRGSLTTPPYSEYLFWTLIPQVYQIQPETLELFKKKFPVDGKSPVIGEPNRKVQALNDRTIYYVDLADQEETIATFAAQEAPVVEVTTAYPIYMSLLALGAISFVLYKRRKSSVSQDDRYNCLV